MADNITNYSNVGIGQLITASFLSAVTAGSLVIGGSTYVNRDQAATVHNYFGTGSYLSYDDVVCTNTGGLAKYTACSWQNPSSTQSGTLIGVQVDSEAAPAAATITCTTSPNGTATGTSIFKYAATASGQSVGAHNPVIIGSNSGKLLLVPPSWYVRCWHSTTPGPGLKEQLRIWYSGFYTP